MITQQDLFEDEVLKQALQSEVDTSGVVSDEEESEIPLSYEDFDYGKLNIYAGIDCIATLELLSKTMEVAGSEEPVITMKGLTQTKSSAPAVIQSFHEIEIPAHEFLIDLEINGMKYSAERNQVFSNKMIEEVGQLEDKIFTGIGQKLDLNSGPAIAQFLYEQKGFEPPFTTKGGEPATDGMALMTLAGLDPFGNKYVTKDPTLQYLADMAKRRDISSVHSTFIKTYVKDFVKRDGRIHPSYNQFGTSSFRISGSDPNLTQLPRPKHGYNVRCCYTVEPGNVFISFDFSSAEVKVLANIAKEKAMLKAIADGLDFHSFSASAMRGIPYDEFVGIVSDQTHALYKEYKGYRQLAKTLTFSILYGSSVGGIAKQLNLSKEEAERLVNMYFKTFPGVKNYIDEAHKFALHNQFSITPLGQRKRQFGTYPCFKPTAAFNASLRNSQNFIIQSATSSIGLAAFTELNRRIKQFGAKSTCTVYDSVEIECPIEHAAAVINLAYETLNTFPQEAFPFLELPIGCEGDVGISWGETRVVHEGTTIADVHRILEEVKQESIKTFGRFI